jgi:hypothetical protein
VIKCGVTKELVEYYQRKILETNKYPMVCGFWRLLDEIRRNPVELLTNKELTKLTKEIGKRSGLPKIDVFRY